MSKLTIEINDKIYKLDKSFKFSDGAIQIRLKSNMETPDLSNQKYRNAIYIRTCLDSSDSIMELQLTCNALRRRYPKHELGLITDYFPYARQDRACVDGEAFSLEVMCNIINSLKFETVYISDAHSDITLDLLNNVIEKEQWEYVRTCINRFDIDIDNIILVSPDKGALEKISLLADHYGKTAINAYKVRCPDTGEIIETRIDIDDFNGSDVFIVDDLCDGGRTFIELAKILRTKNCGKILLYITHGIFSKGTDIVFEYIDEIYTTSSIWDSHDTRVNVIENID